MTGPEISPLLGRLGGEGFRKDLKKRLEELANETDDKAYASRLRLVARGDRPLRTLLHDPSWSRQFEDSLDPSRISDNMKQEGREAFDERIAAIRDAHPAVFVTPEEAEGDAAEIARMADRSRSIIAQEDLVGWSHVHEVDQNNEGPQKGHHEH